ncbi:hypothetical protein GCM10020331_013100 [Ectobacillus funiculus]
MVSVLSTLMNVTTYKFYMNGEWKESSSQQAIEIYSPYSLDLIGRVQAITREEIDEAISFCTRSTKKLEGSFLARSCTIFI